MLIVLGTLAFLLEVTALIAVARWGWQTGQSPLMRWLLAILVPLTFMVFWGVFLSPKANVALPNHLKSALQLLVFALAAWAAAQVWGRTVAITFLLAAAATLLLAQLSEGQS